MRNYYILFLLFPEFSDTDSSDRFDCAHSSRVPQVSNNEEWKDSKNLFTSKPTAESSFPAPFPVGHKIKKSERTQAAIDSFFDDLLDCEFSDSSRL